MYRRCLGESGWNNLTIMKVILWIILSLASLSLAVICFFGILMYGIALEDLTLLVRLMLVIGGLIAGGFFGFFVPILIFRSLIRKKGGK